MSDELLEDDELSNILEYIEDLYEDNEEIEEEEVDIYEDYFHKNTPSFQCFTQVDISRSSLLRDPLYQFPELEDPDIKFALYGFVPPKTYDNIGIERYIDLCKEEHILPFRRVLQSLDKEILNLKYYKLSEKAMRTICETLVYNVYVEELILQENFFKPEAVAYLNPLLEKNDSLQVLDLKQCNLGLFGVEAFQHGISVSKCLTKLDLSHNDLGDGGVEILAKPMRKNISIKILNLSHNNLSDRALIALNKVLRENRTLIELDLSWNYFYSPVGMTALMSGMTENKSIKKLSLAWNGIGTEVKTIRYILKYLKGKTKIQHLDLSNNRISGPNFRKLRRALKTNKSIVSLNVGFNPITAVHAEYLAGTFFDKRQKFKSKLIEVDVGDTYVTKQFKDKLNKIKEKGFIFKYGGILGDYEIIGPDFKELLLNRGKFISANMKKKKQRIDIGEVIIMIQQDEMKKGEFNDLLKKNKIKWDQDLIDQVMKEFRNEKKRVNTQLIKEMYLSMYPDTKPPEPKKKKGKGRKKKKAVEVVDTEVVEVSQDLPPSQSILRLKSRTSTLHPLRPSMLQSLRTSKQSLSVANAPRLSQIAPKQSLSHGHEDIRLSVTSNVSAKEETNAPQPSEDGKEPTGEDTGTLKPTLPEE